MPLTKNKVASTPKRKSVRPPPPPWLELPEDITGKILHKLGVVGILWSAQYVCTSWRKICRDPTMWHVIDMWNLGDVHSMYSVGHSIETLFILAVDLGQGHVTEINVDGFGEYYLEYIANKCGNLRCLRGAFCEDISGRAFSKELKRFPLLEELHHHCVPVRKRLIEAIGQSCPMLKTFALNRGRGYNDRVLRRSNDALAIAKFMPELHHLKLFGNRLTNDVLDAILSGCPKLESLDIRQCFNLNLEGELGKRCAQQIKTLWRPHDPPDTNDDEWLAKTDNWERYYHETYETYDYEDIMDFDDEYDSLQSYSDDYEDDYEDDDLSDPYQSDGGSDE